VAGRGPGAGWCGCEGTEGRDSDECSKCGVAGEEAEPGGTKMDQLAARVGLERGEVRREDDVKKKVTNDAESRLKILYGLFDLYKIKASGSGPHMNFWVACINLVCNAMMDFGSNPNRIMMFVEAKPGGNLAYHCDIVGQSELCSDVRRWLSMIFEQQDEMEKDPDHAAGLSM
jgi:hypothetical protein